MELMIRIIITLLAYFIGREIGKLRQEPNRFECRKGPIVTPKIFLIPNSSKLLPLNKCNSTSQIHHLKKFQCDVKYKEINIFTIPGSIVFDLFPNLHHPASPSKFSLALSENTQNFIEDKEIFDANCNQIYLTRTGSRSNQPNKCVAIVKIPTEKASINDQSHRIGYTALLSNQYQADYVKHLTFLDESFLFPPFLTSLDMLIPQIVDILTEKGKIPIQNPMTGKPRTIIVMVANEGVFDLILNFLCSIESLQIPISDILVFVGNLQAKKQIELMGVHAFFHPSLSMMPPQAAHEYMDDIFSRLMWYKTTSVYLTLHAGFQVLFQDVDLIWLRNPIPYLESNASFDVLFMDDGARTPRFTPYFVNSGFYHLKHTPNTLYFMEKILKASPSEISQTHSHQAVLIRHLAEAVHMFQLKVLVLPNEQFPSGQAFHESPKYVEAIKNHQFKPYVFHMCWTDNRENKVLFFQQMNLWFLHPKCSSPPSIMKEMLQIEQNKLISKIDEKSGSSVSKSESEEQGNEGEIEIYRQCCWREKYWT